MKLVPVPLPTQTRRGRFGEDGSQRLINAVLEKLDQGHAVYARPGLVSFATLSGASGGVRALTVVDNTLYVVAGRQVYQVTTGGAVTQLTGGIAADGSVRHARNMATIPMTAFVAGGVVTILQGGKLTDLSDSDLPPPVDVGFLNGYFIYAGRGSFYWSAINDSGVDALDFASNESNPDNTVRLAIFRNEAWFFGENTIEVWANSSDADAPFQRLGGGAIPIGIGAAGSLAEIDQTLIWIDEAGVVRQTGGGYSANRISFNDIERDIAAADQTTIEATAFRLHGHSYYLMSCANWTWVYDLTAGTWSEWQSYGYDRWNISSCVAFDGRVIAGSSTAGTLYEVDADAFDDAGTDLVWVAQTSLPKTFPARARFNALFCELITGRGVITGDDEDVTPEVMLRVSRDGGNTWGNEHRISAGAIGERARRVIFRRLGLSKNTPLQIEMRMSAAVGRGLTGLAAQMDATLP